MAVGAAPPVNRKISGQKLLCSALKSLIDFWSSLAFRDNCMRLYAVFAMFWHEVEDFYIKECAAKSTIPESVCFNIKSHL